MGIILWIILGALTGWVASMLVGGGGGLFWDMIVGTAGAVIGGFLMNSIGHPGIGGLNLHVTLLSALVLIATVRAVRRS
ncbi:MAG: GlsB/YeaQ/YmgE family stress response membrane protein [Minisyncoccota bacterium]